MRKFTAVVSVVFLVVFSLSFTGCSKQSSDKSAVINSVCPVMGNAVDSNTPYRTVYKGKTVGFCCPACVDMFKSDPEKYMAKIK